jgi:transcriptional regulator with XRE-family HTH domain
MPRIDPENQRVAVLGEALFGPRWHTEFAKMTGVSRPYVSLIAKGKRPVTDEVRKAIIAGLKQQADQTRRRADALMHLSAEYLK